MGTISLNLDNVSKSFASADTNNITHALSDITLRVKDGEFLSIVGPSGCGKSTTLRIIGGFEKPDGGRVLFEGKDPKTAVSELMMRDKTSEDGGRLSWNHPGDRE